jgi:hypothetical protein
MKPMHSQNHHTSRCPCCRSNFSAGNAGSKKNHQALKAAKGSARQFEKRQMRKEFE